MPIIGVNLTAGRDDTVKSFIARTVVDAVAEFAGVSLDNIHVLFTDTERSSWAIGPRLLSESAPRPPTVRPMPYQRACEISLDEDGLDDYLTWRRHRLYPLLGATDGFLSTSVVELPDHRLVISERWRTNQACREFEATTEYRDLFDEIANVVTQSSILFAGTVADTWNRPAR